MIDLLDKNLSHFAPSLKENVGNSSEIFRALV
ncbi:hypothetical protein [Metabacillus bambusae]